MRLQRSGSAVESRKLDGCSVLLVEDEIVILMDLQAAFEAAGARVIAANRPDEALSLADTAVLDAAVIDFSLGEEDGGAVCHHLSALGVPFVFHSAHDHETVSPWLDAPVIRKPSHPECVLEAVAAIVGMSDQR